MRPIQIHNTILLAVAALPILACGGDGGDSPEETVISSGDLSVSGTITTAP